MRLAVHTLRMLCWGRMPPCSCSHRGNGVLPEGCMGDHSYRVEFGAFAVCAWGSVTCKLVSLCRKCVCSHLLFSSIIFCCWNIWELLHLFGSVLLKLLTVFILNTSSLLGQQSLYVNPLLKLWVIHFSKESCSFYWKMESHDLVCLLLRSCCCF